MIAIANPRPPSVPVLPPEYSRWWRTFRALSNETRALAPVLAGVVREQLGTVRRGDGWRLIDVGCGDGRLTAAFLEHLKRQGGIAPSEIILIDPLPSVDAALRRCLKSVPSATVAAHQLDLRTFIETRSLEEMVTLSIAVHSAYYIAPDDLGAVASRHSNLGMVVAVDAANSPIAETWRRVNPPIFRAFENLYSWLTMKAAAHPIEIRVRGRIPTANLGLREALLSFVALREFRRLRSSQRREVLSILNHHRSLGERLTFEFFVECFLLGSEHAKIRDG